MVIYLITNQVNGKQYIGQTKNLNQRLTEHFTAKNGKSLINRSICKNGKHNFTVEIMHEKLSQLDANDFEEFYIRVFQTLSPNGYNLLPGGNNHSHSLETRIKISATKKGIPALYLRNKPKTFEHKEKLRVAKLGKKQTIEHKMNAAKARVGLNLKPIQATHRYTNEILVFKGLKFAAECGFLRGGIITHLNGNYSHYKNYVWKYTTSESEKVN